MENEYDENRAFLMEGIISRVKFGFTDLETIIDNVCEQVDDEGWESDFDEDWVGEQVKEQYKKRQEESGNWKYPTDTDRLALAFDHMRKAGIVALHFAGYTQSDSMADVAGLYAQLKGADKKAIGHCFYHEQDLERVIGNEGGTLLLGFYGSDAKDEAAAIAVAHAIIRILQEQGFTAEWEHDLSKRISIKNFKWQKVYTSEEELERWDHAQVLEAW